MKKFYMLILSAILTVLNAEAQTITFNRTYTDGWNYIYGRALQQTTDGGYIVAGYINNVFTGTELDVYVMKTNQNGDTAWTKYYGGSKDQEAHDIKKTSDGGYIITGYKEVYNGLNWLPKMYLLKINANGDSLWSKTYERDNSHGYSVQQTTDGGYIVAGTGPQPVDFGSPNTYMYLLKTNATGDSSWSEHYEAFSVDPPSISESDVYADKAYSVQQTSDGGYILAAQVQVVTSPSTTNNFGYVLKVNTNGVIEWEKTYGKQPSLLKSVQQTTDGGYIITGKALKDSAKAVYGLYAAKLNSTGDTTWTKMYGNIDVVANIAEGNSVKQTTDGGYAVTGYVWNDGVGTGTPDIWLLRLNTAGDTVCTGVWGGSSSDYGEDVEQTSDGGFIITGWELWGKIYLIKTDSTCKAETVTSVFPLDKENNLNEVKLFPNPMKFSSTLNFQYTPDDNLSLDVFDLQGKKVRTFNYLNSDKIIIEKGELHPGVYFYKVFSNKQVIASGKMIVQ